MQTKPLLNYIHEPLIKDFSSHIFQHFEQFAVLGRVFHHLQMWPIARIITSLVVLEHNFALPNLHRLNFLNYFFVKYVSNRSTCIWIGQFNRTSIPLKKEAVG